MIHPSPHDDDLMHLKPRPRRPFELGTSASSTQPSSPTTPSEPATPNFDSLKLSTSEGGAPPSRTRSILNLTSSTLFGIYQPTGYDTNRDDTTPWGTGAQTPVTLSRNASVDWTGLKLSGMPDTVLQKGPDGKIRPTRSTAAPRTPSARKGFRGYVLPLVGRELALFGAGILYGLLIGHLHDRQNLAPVKLNLNHWSWPYRLVWGLAGVLLGEALPWVDRLWTPEVPVVRETGKSSPKRNSRGVGDWNDVVRSITAFVGVAFAIRKLPWQSTLQLSLTLALANPAVWYLIDRSAPGFLLSVLVSLSGTALVLGVNPDWIPPPAMHNAARRHLNVTSSESAAWGLFNQESVGAVTWIASVLFVSAVCFGNIGRRLATQQS